ncbi:hypothetical protein EZ698_09055 [Salmonella enterica subsp. enterica serovar Agona]|nr:hypothetical protein [Salmonella enterica subsp. enterica serovar Agona]ECF0663129.1 hypothetical protein [Salmonella enterica subsp. enterica serovar Agona]ECG2563484.1 hypothetical protein [Salmonella enterica subsp. enterica serovar Agona]
MPDGGVNVLSGLHDPLFPRRFFEIHHKIIAFRRQKTRTPGENAAWKRPGRARLLRAGGLG